jgi:hypothetical protein
MVEGEVQNKRDNPETGAILIWGGLTRQTIATRRLDHLPSTLSFEMPANPLKNVYDELIKAFKARPSDLKKCGTLLNQLKVSYLNLSLNTMPTIHQSLGSSKAAC